MEEKILAQDALPGLPAHHETLAHQVPELGPGPQPAACDVFQAPSLTLPNSAYTTFYAMLHASLNNPQKLPR